MSGTTAQNLSTDQANAVLAEVLKTLRVVLTSPLRTPPGETITASLVPAAPTVDASHLVDGVLNVALVAKDVLYNGAGVVDVPPSGDLAGDTLAAAAGVTKGQPFPPVAPTPTVPSGPTPVPGLLAQGFGTFSLPRVDVRLDVKWLVRDAAGNLLTEEDGKIVAPSGVGTPTLSLVVPPVFRELRIDTVTPPPTPEVVCLSAEVTLTLGTVVLGPVEVGPVPVVVLPLMVPTVVFLFSEPNFATVVRQDVDGNLVDDSSCVIVVPKHSPFASAEALFRALRRVEKVVDTLSTVGAFAGFLLGLDCLGALDEQPRLRFYALDTIDEFGNVKLKPRKVLGFTYGYSDFDDRVRSILVLGLPGTRVHFFNDEFQKGSEDTDQGDYLVEVGDEMFVAIRDLDTPSDEVPVTLPPDRVVEWAKDHSTGNDGKWHTDLSSMCFDAQWLEAVAAEEEGTLPQLVCAAPTRPPETADLSVGLVGRVGNLVVTLTNQGPAASSGAVVALDASGVYLAPAKPPQGTVRGSGAHVEWDVGALASGATVELRTIAKPQQGDWTVTATAKGSGDDPDSGNNTATVNVVG
jgi:hypothetical protein